LKSFTYLFEELPLVQSGGYSACEVSGLAEICYDAHGGWSIERIGFDGFRPRVTAPTLAPSDQPQIRFERANIWLDAGDPIQLIVHDRLEHDWSARVQRQVDDRLLDDGDGADRSADHTIALRQEVT
jgi:hypothetical protein